MRIEKRSYSSGAWRLIGEDGNDVYAPTVLDHPTMGKSIVSMPVCADTKQGVVDRVLGMLAKYVKNDCSEIVRWTRPEDSMPDADTEVLIFVAGGTIAFGFTDGEKWFYEATVDGFEREAYPVLYWAEPLEGPKR